MTETMAQPRAARRVSPPWPIALVVAVWLAGSLSLIRHLEDPPRTAFAVRNDTVWDIAVHVRTGPEAVMPIATVPAERTIEVREVLVPGDTWEFLWRIAGEEVGSTTVEHDSLLRSDFELRVPDQVSDSLRARGAPPAP